MAYGLETFPWWVYPLIAWTILWKAVGFWHSARNNQLVWFILFLVVNTAGILPIIYLLWFQNNRPSMTHHHATPQKKSIAKKTSAKKTVNKKVSRKKTSRKKK